ncbi:hypothetical protein GCM10023237_69940 [Streptomyces coeruleoprunus]|uniref:hypothetical protein n=1 Tax=Streptomyces coeruleoprunus TaxID=285563 RepID=UPI0031EBAD12
MPADQLCAEGKDCKDRNAPTFFTRKRLVAVNTEILKDGKHHRSTPGPSPGLQVHR